MSGIFDVNLWWFVGVDLTRFFEGDFSRPKMAKQNTLRMVRFWDTILQQELPVEDMGLVYLETVYPM